MDPRLVSLAVLCAALAAAEPRPGDIYKEYRYTSNLIVELDPGSKRTDPKLLMRRSISHRERSLDVWDLEDATRAELALEFWGGHVGTSDVRVKVNGGSWLPVPQIGGTPGNPLCFFRMLPGSTVVPIALSALRQGRNSFQFEAGPQVCRSFDWGIIKVYSFILRVYYNESKAHPTGRIVSPRRNEQIGDRPIIKVEAHGTKGIASKTEFTGGPVTQVDVIGLYEDFNWEGDGQFRRWHYQTQDGQLQMHIGSTRRAPWEFTWNNTWVPDQKDPVEIAARITDAHGITYVTPAVATTLARSKRSVRMYKAYDIPEEFSVRAGKTKSCKIDVTDDPSRAVAARLVLSTWAGEHAESLTINDKKIADHVGASDYYSYDSVPFDPKLLKKGTNVFAIFSGTKEHAAEVNWPGPVILLEFPGKADN